MGSMNENPRNLKKLVAGTAAVIFTVAAAGAAVAVNLGTADPASGSPAGKLASTQPVLATPVDTITPSTIYLDVDVPIQGTASDGTTTDPATASGSGTATDPSSPGATASGPSSSSHSGAGGDSIDPDSHDESDDSDRKDKAGEEREHKDGAEDDD